VEFVLKCGSFVFVPIVLFSAMIVVLELDYLSAISIPAYLKDIHKVVSLVLFFMRLLYLLIVVYFLSIPMIALVIFSILVIFIISDIIFHLKTWIDFYYDFGHRKAIKSISPFFCIKGLNGLPNSRVMFLTHIQIKILQQFLNDAVFYLFPSLLLFGGSWLVMCNVASIKMHSIVPMPYYFAIPGVSISLSTILILLFPMTSVVHERSREFIRKFHLIHFHHKYWSRVAKAQHPFHFDLGALFIAKKSTQMTYMQCIFDITVDALLLFDL